MKWIETMTGNYTPSARVVDGTLIISLPHAITPVVWRMELGHAKSSAMEVRQQENIHMLTLKTPRGDVNDIAPFDSRGKAVQALMTISRAMEQAHGHMYPYAAANNSGITNLPAMRPESARQEGKNHFAAGIASVVLLLGLIAFLVNMSSPHNIAPASGNAEISTHGGSTPANTGVAQDADAFLNNR